MQYSVRRILLSLLVVLLCPYAHAQSGQFSGKVNDPQGAAVVGAQLHIVNVSTNVERTLKTNDAGEYIAPGLTPGTYKITVEASGFSTSVNDAITLNVAQNAVLDFKLQVGSASSQVEVNADNLSVNTTDGSVSTVIDRQFVENIPLNGRSFQSLIYLSPGITSNVATSNSAFSQGQFTVNGQRGDANYWMVDGVSANISGGYSAAPGAGFAGAVGASNTLGGTSALVSVDALQEFRIETSTYGPEFGRLPGAQISIQTRSGTNAFHGTLFNYLRNGDLDATDWFADHDSLVKPLEIQNDFGGVLGGPIIKNKTFFFFSAEGLRLLLPQTYQGTVPDMATRNAAIPAMQPYFNVYPLPKPGETNTAPGSGLVPYSTTFSEPSTADAFSLRIDHQALSKLNLFARYNHAPSTAVIRGAGTAANMFRNATSITKTATIGATWVQSAEMINELRLNYSVSGGSTFENSDSFGGGTPFPKTNLFPSTSNPFAPGAGFTFQNSDIEIGPLFGTNMATQYGIYSKAFQHQWNLVDTFSLQSGPHNLKLGVDYRRLLPTSDNVYFQLCPLFDNLVDMMAGTTGANGEMYVFLNAPQTFLVRNLGLFAQDTWRVNPRLNLTYGLRWDVDFVPKVTRGLGLAAVTGFSTTSLSNLALAPLGTPPYSTHYGNVAPRIGGAYRASMDPDWGLVVRGGFGLFYGLASSEIFNVNYNSGYYPVGAYEILPNAAWPATPAEAALPVIQAPNAQNGQTIYAMDPNLNLPYALEWSAAVEQSLGKAQTFTLSYVGAADKRLLASEYIANHNPSFGSAYLLAGAGSSNFQALEMQFQRHLTNGLQALASYTWSHSIDTGSYGAFYNGGSFADIAANRAASDSDVRNSFSGALTYNVPAWKTNLITRAITGGWSTDNEVQIRSGAPVDVADANFSAIEGNPASIVIRPDVVAGQPLYLTGSQYPGRKALNPAAFVDPPMDPVTHLPTRQGNLSRNARRSLGLSQWDFAARREFPIYEGVKLQFKAELFNILNHPNFAPFNNQFQNGNIYFGQATEMENQFLGAAANGGGNSAQNPLYTPGGPRSGELALKLVFYAQTKDHARESIGGSSNWSKVQKLS